MVMATRGQRKLVYTSSSTRGREGAEPIKVCLLPPSSYFQSDSLPSLLHRLSYGFTKGRKKGGAGGGQLFFLLYLNLKVFDNTLSLSLCTTYEKPYCCCCRRCSSLDYVDQAVKREEEEESSSSFVSNG